MEIYLNGEPFEIRPDNTIVLHFENDLLDGVYLDMEENYAFISRYTPEYETMYACAMQSDVREVAQHEEIDLGDAPYIWIVSALGRIIAEAAEEIANESQ